MRRRLLVLATTAVDQNDLRDRVREHSGDEDVDVRVVAPAVELSPLEWLASDEDEAREEAAGVARETKQAVRPDAEQVEAEVGDTDPLQAIEDALRQFAADEVLVLTRRDEEARWLEEGTAEEARERFRVPITHVVAD
jgi:GABA permease